ncbi:MAG TPA: hypothetical protein VFJ85_07355 [Acidimicrobiales bacterium]|nr:hypothetical protein [Acidimicrobiales bacterium]
MSRNSAPEETACSFTVTGAAGACSGDVSPDCYNLNSMAYVRDELGVVVASGHISEAM